MGTRIVTTDVEIIDAVIGCIAHVANVTEDCDTHTAQFPITPEEIHYAAHLVIRELTKPPEKTSDITGFKEDDQ